MSYILCRLGRKTGKVIPRMFNMLISRFGIMGDVLVCIFLYFLSLKKNNIGNGYSRIYQGLNYMPGIVINFS